MMFGLRRSHLYNVFLLLIFLAIIYFISNQILSQDQPNSYQITDFEPKFLLNFNSEQIVNNSVAQINHQNSSSTTTSSIISTINIDEQEQEQEQFTEKVSETTQIDWFKIFKDTVKKVSNIFSPNYLPEFRKWAIDKERSFVANEMIGYKFQNQNTINRTMNDFVMEKGGNPIRNVIFTTWRSGSTFLGDILDSHPANFYHYEPLLHYEIVQVRSGKLAQDSLRVLKDLLYCRYSNLTDYLKYGEESHWVFNHNSRVWQYCEKNHEVCWDPEFQSKMCRLFPFQSLKTVRMRLKLGNELLADPKLDIRLLLLIRDPRGTIQSRKHREWCPGNPDCDEPTRLCSDLVQDYYDAKKLRRKYPGRFMSIRYEDISRNPYSAVKKLFRFFRLEFHPKVEEFLDSHTRVNIGGVSSTFRDSKAAPFHWKKDFTDFSEIETIQKSCGKAMSLWGYKIATDTQDLAQLGFDPVLQPPWPEMKIPQDQDQEKDQQSNTNSTIFNFNTK